MIGERIKNKRIELNMSQDELAEKLFVTRQTISNYELGKTQPSIDILQSISKIFECDLMELIGEDTKVIFVNKKLNILPYLIVLLLLGIYVFTGFWEVYTREQMNTNYILFWPYMHIFYFKRTMYLMFSGLYTGSVIYQYFKNHLRKTYTINKTCAYSTMFLVTVLTGVQLMLLGYIWTIFRPEWLNSKTVHDGLKWISDNQILMVFVYMVCGFILTTYKSKRTLSKKR